MEWTTKRGNVGFVSIVGRPNAGKSTLINTILDYKLAAVTNRPHTTRQRWLGIYSTNDCQIIFTDTPGIHETRNKLYEAMHQSIMDSLNNNDIILILVDAYRQFGNEDKMLIETVKKVKKKVILAINKVDIATVEQQTNMKKNYCQELGEIPIFELSALQNEGIKKLISYITDILPIGPFLFDPEQIANVHIRDIACELIRESAIEKLVEEVPHSIAVQIEKWEEKEKKIKIYATFYVERNSQKSILIGKNGAMITQIKQNSILKLRKNFEKFIDLHFHIKILPKWQNNENFLKELGLN